MGPDADRLNSADSAGCTPGVLRPLNRTAGFGQHKTHVARHSNGWFGSVNARATPGQRVADAGQRSCNPVKPRHSWKVPVEEDVAVTRQPWTGRPFAQRAWWDAEADGTTPSTVPSLVTPTSSGAPRLDRGGSPTALRRIRYAARLLSNRRGRCQCSRWLTAASVEVVSDLADARAPGPHAAAPGGAPPLIQCDGTRLPFADATFATVFTAYGVVPFVADSAGLMREVARVLRPGGRFVFSTTHPIRWAFADDPTEAGLRVLAPYFDRSPYVETDASGHVSYVEHHRTIGDRVRECVAAGLTVLDLVEPTWPERNVAEWGGWSPLRGELIPGTLIVVTRKDAAACA